MPASRLADPTGVLALPAIIMAEAFGLISSCVSIVQGLDSIYTFIRENIHQRESVREELTFLVGKVSSYRGIIFGIQLQAELDKVSHDRLSALDQVSGPLEACELATNLINKRLQNLPKRIVFGKVIDKETAESLKVLDNALPVLQLALHADQRLVSIDVIQVLFFGSTRAGDPTLKSSHIN